MKIAVSADHGGYCLKDTVTQTLAALGHEVLEVGARAFDATDDYPDVAEAVGRAVQAGDAERGVAICGSGVGVTIAANKLAGVRACLCHDTYTAAQGVRHDDMNVLCLGGRVIGPDLAKELLRAFVGAEYNPTDRFARRVAKVTRLERG